MTVTIAIPPEDEKKLARLAAATGTDLAEFVRQLIKREIDVPISLLNAAEPFARAVDSSGLGDEEFTSVIEQAKAEARIARRGQGQI